MNLNQDQARAIGHKSLADVTGLVVSVHDTDGTPVYLSTPLTLYDFAGTYVSETLSFLPGSYKLTEFLVVDATNSVLYATPHEGSDLAHLIDDPLAIDFNSGVDMPTTVRPQVLSTAGRTPEEFGYVSFEPGVVEVIDFRVAAYVHDEASGGLVLTTAGIEVTGDSGLHLYSGSLDAMTSKVTVPAGHGQYRVVISKAEYVQYSQVFSASDLASYFADSDNGPLTVTLSTGLIASMTSVQSIPTNGALDWEHFEIGGEHYLALANQRSSNSTFNINSTLYRWSGSALVEIQSIPTSGAMDWEHFEIGSEHYLAVANYYNGSTRNIDSKVYRWNGSAFVEFQSIPTGGAQDWEHFEIGSEHYLALANWVDGPSKVYRWNGSAFDEIQSFSTGFAQDWEHFEIGNEHYLALTKWYEDFSKVYRWDGSAFVEFQIIPGDGAATDWEHFEIGNEHYLAIGEWSGTSKVYRWDGSAFVELQSIPTSSPNDWEYFEIGDEHYLAVANAFGTSEVYRWNGSAFVADETISTNYASSWQHFALGSEHYLAVTNFGYPALNVDSTIYRLNLE